MSLLRRCAGPLVVAATGVAMLSWTWDTWPDPITDFGKEVYIAQQLSLGRHLYTDIAYHLGPLSPYVNALAFKLFGPTLATLEILNFCVLTAIAVLFYRLLRRMAGELAATIAGITLMCLFAFTHFTPITDYNYIAPYDHCHTHGLLLGLLAITFADHSTRSKRHWPLFAAGLSIGLVFLTRAELSVAALTGTIALLLTHRLPPSLSPPLSPSPGTPGEGGGEGLRSAETPWMTPAIFSLGILTPIILTWLLLCLILSPSQSFTGILGAWPRVFDHTVVGNSFYRDSMGTLDTAYSATRLLRWTLIWCLLLFPPLALGRLRSRQLLCTAAAFVYAIVFCFFIGIHNDFGEAFSPLPVALLACFFLLPRLPGPTRPLTAGLLVWALTLLGKILLNARIQHYGFALAMPATLLLVAIGIGWTKQPARAALVATLAMIFFGYLFSPYATSALNLMRLQVNPVGQGPNRFLADDRGVMLNELISALQQKSFPHQTLAVMPEGAMLNFLTNMPNPTPYWSYQPPFSFFAPGRGEAVGEQKVLQSLINYPPDWIVLADPSFGRDFAASLYAFTQHGYSTEFTDETFGVILLRRLGYNNQHALSLGR